MAQSADGNVAVSIVGTRITPQNVLAFLMQQHGLSYPVCFDDGTGLQDLDNCRCVEKTEAFVVWAGDAVPPESKPPADSPERRRCRLILDRRTKLYRVEYEDARPKLVLLQGGMAAAGKRGDR